VPEEARRKREHRRGEGSVYQDRSTRVWVAAFTVGWKDGKRIRRKRVSRDGTKPGAQRELARLQRWYGDTGDVGLMTLGAYLDDWLDIGKPTMAPRTWATYEAHVRRHISPLLGGIHVATLRPNDVRRLVRDRVASGLSAQTVHAIVSTLRTALAVAVDDGELPRNAASRADLPPVDRAPVDAMTAERAAAILDAVKDDAEYGALFTLLLGCGLRIGEATALEWSDIDLDSGRLTIRRGKTRAARRTIPLPRFVHAALVEHRGDRRRTGLVWTAAHGKGPLRRNVALDRFRACLAAAGLPSMTLHQLRHGTATLLVQRGVPMRDVSEIMGHSDPAMTARFYAHVSDGSKRKAMRSLDELAG
jgi:integrase